MAGEEKFRKLRTQKADLEVAARDRLDDAVVLLQGGRFASAIAMGLYALEVSLKVAICNRLDLDALPQALEIHDLGALLVMAGLSKTIDHPTSATVQANWGEILVNFAGQLNDLRYFPNQNWTRQDAETLLGWLNDPRDGVLTWLSRQP